MAKGKGKNRKTKARVAACRADLAGAKRLALLVEQKQKRMVRAARENDQ